MVDLSALYPRPPQPGAAAGLLGQDPAQLVGLMSQLNQLKQSQAIFASKQAAGNALQSSITSNPDGTASFNPDKALAAVQADPNAGLSAPEAIGNILDFRQKNIANATGQFTLATSQNQYLMNGLASLADKPGVSKSDVANFITTYARNGNVPSSILTGWMAGLPDGGAPLQNSLKQLASASLSAGERATRVTGPPTPTGAPTQQGLGQAVMTGGAQPTALAPGVAEQQSANMASLNADQQKSSAIMANVRPLQTALPIIESESNSNFGGASNGMAKLKGILSTAGVVDPNSTSLPGREEINKYLHMYSGAARGAERSDQGLSQALSSTPNLDLTKPANLALVKNQVAMDKMDAAMPIIFKNAYPNDVTASQYPAFKSTYYQNYDPRAFRFDSMDPKERAALQTSLGPPSSPQKPNPAWDKFVKSYTAAKASGQLEPPQAPNGQ